MSRKSLFFLTLFWFIVAGCEQTGTIQLQLVTPQNNSETDDLRDSISVLRLTVLTDPPQTRESTRDSDGTFELALENTSRPIVAEILVEGFDNQGDVVAVGRTPEVPLNGSEGDIAIYFSPPFSAHSYSPEYVYGQGAAFAPVSTGVLFIGGQGETGPLSNVSVFNAYLLNHEFGLSLPIPLVDPAMSPIDDSSVLIFGGVTEDDVTNHRAWVFHLDQGIGGTFVELTSNPTHGRSSPLLTKATDTFIVPGESSLVISPVDGTVQSWHETLEGPGFTFQGKACFLGTNAPMGKCVSDSLEISSFPSEPAARNYGAAPTAELVFVAGGRDDNGVVNLIQAGNFASGFTTVATLATPREKPTVHVTDQWLIIAGGLDMNGELVDDYELFALGDYAPGPVIPFAQERADGQIFSLGSGYLLHTGGITSSPMDIVNLNTGAL